MRDLSETSLEAAQKKSSLDPAIKITLSLADEDDVVLGWDRLRKLTRIEEPYRINAKEAEFDNSDGYFTDKALQGYKAVISWGLLTKVGEEYSDTSPMWVTWQQLNSVPGRLSCLLTMLGIPDLMDEDEASEDYIPDETDTKTVKTLINQIAGATLACYSDCTAYEVVWESGYDTLADTYKPKDSFRIYEGGSRLAAIKRLMEYTRNVLRYGADGKIHILKPVTTGETYDYEHSLESGHTFFSKAYRKSLILPNRIVVKSQKDDDPQYQGEATSPASYALLPKTKYIRTRLESHAQAKSIAEAVIFNLELRGEAGSAEAPMNCGAELFDYVKVNAFNAQDVYRVGNIGSLTLTCIPEKRIYNMRFGFGDPPTVRHIKELYQSIKSEAGGGIFDRLYAKDAYIENLSIDQINAIWLDPDSNIDLTKIGDTIDGLSDGELYARVKSLHLDAGQIKLDEHVYFKADYDPTTKFDPSHDSLDDIPEGVTYRRARSAALTAAGLVILDQVVVGTYGLVKSTDISAGHIILSTVEGDIDDVDEGSIYGKVRKTEISAGYIKLTTDQNLDAQGIEIVSSSSSTRIRINEYRIAGYKAGVLQFELRASDGRAYTGGGKVILDEDGVEIKGAKLTLKNSAGGYAGQIYIASDGALRIDPWLYCRTKHQIPISSGSYSLGDATYKYKKGYFSDTVYSAIFMGLNSASLLRLNSIRNFTGGDGAGNIGYSGEAFQQLVVVNLYRTNEYTYQNHDDIGLIRRMKEDKGRPGFIDRATIPDLILSDAEDKEGKPTKMIDAYKEISLALGAIKQLADRVEALEAR